MKARGTFSAKNGTWKGKGLDLGAEPHKTMLGKPLRILHMTKSIPFANPVLSLLQSPNFLNLELMAFL